MIWQSVKNKDNSEIAMRRIGIFGGSFDPIHYGHLHLAEEARCTEKLDQVLFMPAWVSPFKQESLPADQEDRLHMVRMAVSANAAFSVSDMEIRQGVVSYTADTLRRCQEMMGEETRLYFITGTDAFLNIETWDRSEELLRNYSFIVGSRPGYRQDDLDQVIRRVRELYGTDVRKMEIPQLDISSSGIRQRIRDGKPVRYLLPDSLIDYIHKKGLYAQSAAEQVPEASEIPMRAIDKAIDEVIRGRLKPSRLAHTYGVADEAVKLALRFCGNACKARTCALFHDVFREVGNLTHGPAAAEYMKREFNIDDEDMLSAVRFHTTGRRGMSLLEKIIFLADAIEPNRSYPGVDGIRLAAKCDLDKACLLSLEHTIRYLAQGGQEIDPQTKEAAADLREKTGGEGRFDEGKESPWTTGK